MDAETINILQWDGVDKSPADRGKLNALELFYRYQTELTDKRERNEENYNND